MSSSSEAGHVVPLAVPELRTGTWTRFGEASVLGDAVTEQTLASLAESTRGAARSQGYAIGWAEGRRAAQTLAQEALARAEQERTDAEARREQEHRAAVTALELAAAHLHDAVAQSCASVADQATELAWELTRELVGHELRSASGADVVRRALGAAPTTPLVRLRMHPLDAASREVHDLVEHGVEVCADQGLSRGDVLVETDEQVLDLRISTALARLREVLG